MYFAILSGPPTLEQGGPSVKALFREEYMTKGREPKPRRQVKVSIPVDTTSVCMEPLLGTQWFIFP